MEVKRKLSLPEITYIIDFIKPFTNLPEQTSTSIINGHKRLLIDQLSDVEIYPSLVDKLKARIELEFNTSIIHPGECVGIVCAQSIGEKNTQTALNTFHKAGQSEKTITEGVPRFQELINTTRHQKIVSHTIYMTESYSDIHSIIDKTCGLLKSIYVNAIYDDISILDDISGDDGWYALYDLIFDQSYKALTRVARIKLNLKKLRENKITMLYVCELINEAYNDIHCTFSHLDLCTVDIYTDTSFLASDNDIQTYVEECVIPNIRQLHVCGVKGVNEVFYTKRDDLWIIETNATSLSSDTFNNILTIECVDKLKTLSNNIWDIYGILGIEATRNFLIQEFIGIMDGINICHAKLLVDRMLYDGTIQSISRYTLKNDSSGVLGKASFEESLDNFLNACMKGEVDNTNGVSASIMCGKRCRSGTGIVDLKIKI